MTNINLNSLYLIGAGGHGKVVLEIAEALGIKPRGLIDAKPALQSLFEYPVYPLVSKVPDWPHASFVISIGHNATRKRLAEEHKVTYTTLVHPACQLTSRLQMGAGTVAMAGVCVNSSTAIGRHVILNTLCAVDHDCEIGDYAHISPRAALGGHVHVGEGTHVGIGASVLPGIRIGKWCTIGAGAVIIRDVPDGATVVGVPGKVVSQVK